MPRRPFVGIVSLTLAALALAASPVHAGQLPNGFYLVLEHEPLPDEEVVELQDAPSLGQRDDQPSSVLLQRQPLLEIQQTERIEVTRAPYGAYVVLITLAADGPGLREMTERYLQRRLAIVIDDQVRASPLIAEVIRGRTFQIDGGYFERADAEALAEVLR